MLETLADILDLIIDLLPASVALLWQMHFAQHIVVASGGSGHQRIEWLTSRGPRGIAAASNSLLRR